MTETPRPGSQADLAHRMALIEMAHAELDRKVDQVAASQTAQAQDIALIRQGLEYSEKLQAARLSSLEELAKGANAKIDGLSVYLQNLLSGETETKQSREGRALVEDYTRWRKTVDDFMSRGRLLGTLALLLVTSNVLAWAAAIYAVVNA